MSWLSPLNQHLVCGFSYSVCSGAFRDVARPATSLYLENSNQRVQLIPLSRQLCLEGCDLVLKPQNLILQLRFHLVQYSRVHTQYNTILYRYSQAL